jgi:predicted ATPase/class 3 adenylate cyclase
MDRDNGSGPAQPSGQKIAMDDRLPTGTVTFLFTDIEGSTRLLGVLGERFADVLGQHQRLLREAFAAAGGVVFGTEGDAMFVAFAKASQAVAGAVEAQRFLSAHPWPPDAQLRVRMGMHIGEAVMGGDNYVGIDVHRTARITAAGHGGQILLSEPTHALVAPSPPEGVSFRDLGHHALKDLPFPEHLYQVAAPGLQEDFPSIRSLGTPRGNLPPQLTSFVGRRRELDEIEESLGATRLLTLTGPGGTGKTRLSLQVASEVQPEYEHGSFVVALASILDPSLVAPTILMALGLREEPGRLPVETLLGHLRDRRMLLVLDNFEQVLAAASVVADILGSAEGVRVLATSRERLHLHGEQEYPVPPLGLPDPMHLPPLEALSQFEAVALFIERARAVKPDFQVTNDNAPAVAEISARLDGLPLAIELAAARVKLLPPEAILKRLGNRLALLAGGARDLPARQQTLRDAIAWSYDLLDEPERRLFARLSVFVEGGSLEAIEEVCGDGLGMGCLEGVESLVNKSLLRQVDVRGEPRLFMLETIREFAMELLERSPEAAEIHGRHAAAFLAVARLAAPRLLGPDQVESLDAFEQDHGNFRAALSWAASSGNLPTALRLAGALWRFWQMRGHLREASTRLEALVTHPEAERDPEALAIGLEAAGGVSYWMGDWRQTERYYQRCLDLRRGLDDRTGLADALYNLSFVYNIGPPEVREPDRSQGLVEEALDLYRELGDRRGQARSLWAMANIHQVKLEWPQCHDAARQALALFRELDAPYDAAWAGHSVGFAATQLGAFDEAREALTESLATLRAANDLPAISVLLADFAVLESFGGDRERGARLWGAALAAEQLSGSGLVTSLETLSPHVAAVLQLLRTKDEYRRFVDEGSAMSAHEAADYALAGGSASV